MVYLDNGATTQMPKCVLDCLMHHYMHQNANVHSGSHCVQPLFRGLGYETALRFSPAFYNTKEEIDYMGACLEKAVTMLRKWR